MDNFTKQLAKSLVQDGGLKEAIRKKVEDTFNYLLNDELQAFLGYEPYQRTDKQPDYRNGQYSRTVDTSFGKLHLKMPRERQGIFKQKTIPPYKRHSDDLETTIITLYRKGVTTRDISELIEKMYGQYYSPTTVSNISQQVADQVIAYHQRQLPDKYFCVYLDATYFPLRRDTVTREALYIALGITPEGHKEVLDYCIAPTENLTVWRELLQGCQNRGLKQVKLFLSDGFVGIKDMLKELYPSSEFQRCLVHVSRNISQKVRPKDRKEICTDFLKIHACADQKAAEDQLQQFCQTWQKRYPRVIKQVQAIADDLLVFYHYPKQIRASIYTTNQIESFNNKLKLKLKGKIQFPNEQAEDNFVGTQILDYNARYFKRVHKGFGQVSDTLASLFE